MDTYVLSKPMAQEMLVTGPYTFTAPLRLLSLFHRNLQSAGGHQESPGVAACLHHEPAEFRSNPQERYYTSESLLPFLCPDLALPPQSGEAWGTWGEQSHVCRDPGEQWDFPFIGEAGQPADALLSTQQVPSCAP